MGANLIKELLETAMENAWHGLMEFMKNPFSSISFFANPLAYYNTFTLWMIGMFMLSVVGQIIMFGYQMASKKKTVQKLFRANHCLSKSISFFVRCYFFTVLLKMGYGAMHYLNPLLIFSFIVESFDLFSYVIAKKQITLRRNVYFLSYTCTVVQPMSYFSVYFLGVSYICETIKELFFLFARYNVASIIYGFFQPVLLTMAFALGLYQMQSLLEIFVPLVILGFSYYDAYFKCAHLLRNSK